MPNKIPPQIQPFITRSDVFAVQVEAGNPAPFYTLPDTDWSDVLASHVEGEDRIGMYTPDENGFARWACIDIDGEGHANPVEDVDAEQDRVILELLSAGYQPFVERSGSGTGWHVWVFWDQPVPARDIRSALLSIAGSNELFPKADEAKNIGNLVWLPWWGGAKSGGQLIDPLMGTDSIRYSPLPPRTTPSNEPEPPVVVGGAKQADVMSALMYINPDIHHDEWVKVLMAIKHGLGDQDGREVAASWSAMGAKWDPVVFHKKWDSMSGTGGTTVGTLYWLAKENGWGGPARKPAKIQARPKEVRLPEDKSHVTIAECVIHNLGQVRGGDGKLYVYQEEKGYWKPYSRENLEREITEYNQVMVGGKPLSLNSTDVSGVRKLVESLAQVNSSWPSEEAGVVFSNGWLGADGELHAVNPESYCRTYVPCEYTGTYGPWFPAELLRMVGGDQQALAQLQEFAGATLMGVAPRYKKMVMLYGPKDSGKSTFLKGLRSLFDDDACMVAEPQRLNDKVDRAPVAGKRFCYMDDMSTLTFYTTGPFKSVIAGGETVGRWRYGHDFTFTPRAGWAAACNSLPDTKDTTGGFFERWLIIDCPTPLRPDEIDPDFEDKLMAARGEIAAWAVEGWRRLVKQNGYSHRDDRSTLDDWQAAQDPFVAFKVDCTEQDPAAKTAMRALYQSYERYARMNNVHKDRRLTYRAFRLAWAKDHVVDKQDNLHGRRNRSR